MASDIDVTQPPFGTPTTSGVRNNFITAKAELEQLQQQSGYVDYNDTLTVGSPINVSPSTWTKLTNNTLGPQTRIRLPIDISTVWDAVANQLDFTELTVDSMVVIRVDTTVTTTTANQVLKLRASMAIGGAFPFTLENTASHFKSAGTQKFVDTLSFYVGSVDLKNFPAELQLWSDAACTVQIHGWYIQVVKNLTD